MSTTRSRADVAPGLVLVAIAAPDHTPDRHAYVLGENGSRQRRSLAVRQRSIRSGAPISAAQIWRSRSLARCFAHCGASTACPRLSPSTPNRSFCSAPGASQRTLHRRPRTRHEPTVLHRRRRPVRGTTRRRVRNVPHLLDRLGELAHARVPAGPIAVIFGHRERAMTGASILRASDHHNLAVPDGGPDDWAAATGRALQAGP